MLQLYEAAGQELERALALAAPQDYFWRPLDEATDGSIVLATVGNERHSVTLDGEGFWSWGEYWTFERWQAEGFPVIELDHEVLEVTW
jgi:hypothetical protein